MANQSPFKTVPQPETATPMPTAPTPTPGPAVPTPEQPVAPAPTPGPVAPPTPTTVTKETKEKTPRSRNITTEDIEFIRNNIKTMRYQEIAETRGISKSQVNRVLQFIREGIRNSAIKIAESRGETAYGTKTLNSKKEGPKPVNDYSNPLTVEARKAEDFINENYSRPDSAGAGGGGQVKEALDDTLSGILDSLNFLD